MIVRYSKSHQGIALIIVMIVITVLTILAGGFAYSMKVETKLASNSSYENDLEWLGRSGVEFGKYVLGQQLTVPVDGAYDALNQKWAGGPGGTNDPLTELSMENNKLGSGTFTVHITDLESRWNINMAGEPFLQQALELIGVPAQDRPTIVESILDWREPGERPRLNGAKDKFYSQFEPKYFCKKGPIDDLAELLLVRGVTPEIYWGGGAPGGAAAANLAATYGHASSGVGLVHLFTPFSTGLINPNTASADVLQLIPGIDPGIAQEILRTRRGLDGQDGTEDDLPFHNPREISAPGLPPQALAAMSRFFTTRSTHFQVVVDARIGRYTRRFVALVRRNSRQDIQTLYFHWK
jgi:general secretion pathway protein K